MKVILLKSVSKLGQAGEVKDVSDGYARNYLLPNQLASLVTQQRLVELQSDKSRQERLARKSLLSAKQTKQALDGRLFTLKAMANAQGTLFAGVTASAISDILKTKGYEIQPSMIELPQPLKHTGDHKVAIDFGDQKRAVITISIIPLRDH
ncbi:50S ribosomal protein L9 [Candidatus Uhrbacteria bacterium RIFCSPLOWO2_12_FULL_46_10]|uniref:Large ribosomal subunit protein bL9 n=1 Tax=Candidatus Uhrbacteria bacterium RIFCSPLOWO2_01_FULL_47_25 TaxID=1802402 RepID=A0A1F7UPQ3_9BACT|nr:MAG: 50S ribosomal protein L9 [Parcubacteria group bacterium GW2011_GWA2_46_9]OGL60977.1 MAG: 50S ribosomal protein L9 [Candidatus Uhrbacteria bacterium RIFCSPHIGHO2_01_FULL_46_23]OGL69189.1 MAG: 50S ribosomal protein L9 [Candidatus Uhrbacteria bacterium RIFCSPHIGHO2_02_FULL_47_29]OGL75309.1 MAG: 50S ribosomal protein L9 [Candidatus Uhrbacteria bacterium RIFCSPHIGHO2_12_FULL_46_13]OGL80252.1 MAG: 50S ribosomal protein L9 [Candidatus Uhrbacteria bacterium RIFCSPLOWO2_01_FULL_47_25]OGL85327.1